MWPKYLPLAIFAYNTFNTPDLGMYNPYELVFGRKSKQLLNLETMPNIKVLGTFKDYYNILYIRLQYLHKLLQYLRSKRLAMINKDRNFFQYNSRDLVYFNFTTYKLIAHCFQKKVIKYVGPLVIYKIIDPHRYLLMTLEGQILRVFFEHESLKPAIIRASQGNM